jgi:Tfp pilus assembly protein PilF
MILSQLVHTSAPSDQSAAWLDLADAFLANQQAEDARQCIEKAKRLAPSSPKVFAAEGMLHQVRESMLRCVNPFIRSISSHDSFLRKQHLQDFDAAIDSFEAALSMDVEVGGVHLSLGVVHSQRGCSADFELAIFHITAGLRCKPHSSEGWCVNGNLPVFQHSLCEQAES